MLSNRILEKWLKKFREGETTKDFYRRVVKETLIVPLAAQGITLFADVRAAHLRDLQQSWLNQGKKLNTIETYRNSSSAMFNWFARHEEDILIKNPWVAVERIEAIRPTDEERRQGKGKDEGVATLPLDLDDDAVNWRLIQSSVVDYFSAHPATVLPLVRRPESFLAYLELLYETGLRRGDAIEFQPGKIKPTANGASYKTIQQKTNDPVTVFLTRELADKLRSLPPMPWRGYPTAYGAGTYPFWDGSCKNLKKYADTNVSTPLRDLGKFLKIPGGLRAHRFRDSFAVNQLNRGMLLEEVSRMLGHANVKMTEDYYAPFVPSREKFLEARQAAARQRAFYVEAREAQGEEVIVN